MRPNQLLLHPIYREYVALVRQNNVIDALKSHEDCIKFYQSIPPEKYEYRYQTRKWSIKEIISHLIDTERYFNSVALDLAKRAFDNLKRNYWVFEQAQNRNMDDLISELAEERRKSVHIYQLFDESEWGIQTEIYDKSVTLLGLGFCAIGHELHHISVIRERYLDN